MKVAVSLFARYREATGRDRVEVEVPEGATVEDVWRALSAAHPALTRYRPHTLFAVGNDYVEPARRLSPGEELACFPPVSGGGAPMYRVTSEPLSADALAEAVTVPEAGGVTVFIGVARNNNAGRRVVALEYEAHVPMAEAKMKEIGEGVRQRWPDVRQVAMHHRVGRLAIGEASVIVAVSAAHRQQAFEACHFAIDRLKETVPIWKREVFEDGAVWVGLQGDSPPAR